MQKSICGTPTHKLKQVEPFFYKICEKCMMKFKQEFGWKYKKYRGDISRYLCARCAPTEQEARSYFLTERPNFPNWMLCDD
jgi:hypothetical protein